MTTLERRYRRMLYAYPAAYRAERGDEIMDTLLEGASAGQTRPTFRERRALLMGGLRARNVQNRRLPMRTNWRLVLLLAIALQLAESATAGIGETGYSVGGLTATVSYNVDWFLALTGAMTVAAVALAWSRARMIGTGFAVVTAVLLVVQDQRDGAVMAGYVLALALLAFPKEPLPRAWLWPVGAVAVISLAESVPSDLLRGLHFGWFMPALAIATLLWTVVDARPALAVCVLAALATAVETVMVAVGPDDGFPMWSLAVQAAVAVAIGLPVMFRMRRQAIL